MKKTVFLALIALISDLPSFSQSCLPEGINFSNQAAINNFQANYPGCSEIEGDVTISGVNITNLNGLSVLTSIGGTLRIAHNDALINLSGLNNLANISGGFLLDTNGALSNLSALANLDHVRGDARIAGNDNLVNLSGLGHLNSVGGDLQLLKNNNLESLSGFNNLDTVYGNMTISEIYLLTSMSGLINLKVVQGNLTLSSLDQLTSLQALSSLNTVGGDLTITDNIYLESLSGLQNINPSTIDNLTISMNLSLMDCAIESICGFLSDPSGSINIYANGQGCSDPPDAFTSCGLTHSCLPHGNYYLITQGAIDDFQTDYPGCYDLQGNVLIAGENLVPLDVLTGIEGDLTITGEMSSLNGLNNLARIGGDFNIDAWQYLNNLVGLDNLQTVGGNFNVKNTAVLLNLVGLNDLDTISGDLIVDSNYDLSSLTGLDHLDYIGGSLKATTNEVLINLSGLEDIDSVGGDVWIHNEDLSSLSGLDNLVSVGGDVIIGSNDLVDLAPLGKLTSIGGMLNLNNTYITSLTGLEGLHSIGGGLTLELNYDLTNISSLMNLKTIGGDLYIHGNNFLGSLSGLDNVEPNSIHNLTITGNGFELSECDIRSICDYLGSPGGTITIYYNGNGCSSEEEIWEACTEDVPELNPIQEIIVCPNPADKEVQIITENEAMIKEVNIYDQPGRRLMHEEYNANPIDVSRLSVGLYVIEIVSDGARVREKLVVRR